MYTTEAQLAKRYIADVQNAANILLNRLEVSNKRDVISHSLVKWGLPFYVSEHHLFYFHGRGCKYEGPNLIIDWDFGYGDEQWCGLDPWKLAKYVEDNHLSEGDYSPEHFKNMFDAYVSQGKMIKKLGLYYFT